MVNWILSLPLVLFDSGGETTRSGAEDGTNGHVVSASDNESLPDAQEEEEGEPADPWEDLDPESEVVDLNHNRLRSIDERIRRLTVVETLTMRWNFIKRIENLSPLVTLRELELYDNQLTKIENLEALVNLE